jgi:hypothetical protein
VMTRARNKERDSMHGWVIIRISPTGVVLVEYEQRSRVATRWQSWVIYCATHIRCPIIHAWNEAHVVEYLFENH